MTSSILLAHKLTGQRNQPLAAYRWRRLYLTALFGQFHVVQHAGEVNQEAASVAVQTPLGSTDGVQHQSAIIALWA